MLVIHLHNLLLSAFCHQTPFYVWNQTTVVVASRDAPISVHASKATSGSADGYLAHPLTWNAAGETGEKLSYLTASYEHVGKSVVTVASFFNETKINVTRNGLNVISQSVDLQVRNDTV